MRRLRSAPARINHQIGAQRLFRRSSVTALNLQPGNLRAMFVGGEVIDIAGFNHAHIRQRVHALADLPLQQRATEEPAVNPAEETGFPDAEVMPAKVFPHVYWHRPQLLQSGHEIGKKLHEDLLSAIEQPVHMAALRHAFPRLGALRQRIPLDERDLGEVIGQHPRRQQARHARADDHCMTVNIIPWLIHPDLHQCVKSSKAVQQIC